MGSFEMIGFSCLGGIVPDVLRIIAARYDGPPKYLKRGFFWLSLLLLVILAGVTSLLVKPEGVVEALAVGFGGPEIISKLLKGSTDRGITADGSILNDLRSWWAV